jgi:thiosulfate reductase cytochrome b subunit
MAQAVAAPPAPEARGHARWVRVSHWIAAASIVTLGFSGVAILMAHPRLYWGHAGNDLIPALVEFPISPNYNRAGYDPSTPFSGRGGLVTANRNYEPFNQNGWARSLHFLAAWWLVLPGLAYLAIGLRRGHFRAHIWPRSDDARNVGRELADHVRLRIPPAMGGPAYGVLQKIAYSIVVFVLAPVMVLTGLTMSPAVTAAMPVLLTIFNGYQSARTIHFVAFASLLLFVLVHVVMVVLSGFVRQMRAMTWGIE